MEMFKQMLVLLIFITSVKNQCLLPVKTGNWNLLIPIIVTYTDVDDEMALSALDLGTYPHFTEEIEQISLKNVYVRKRGCLVADDVRMEKKPFFTSYDDYAVVMTHGTFKDGVFYERQTKRFYTWDTSIDYLSTYYKAEAEVSVLNGSTTQFITFNIGNGVNFSLQLVERDDDIWTTNEPFFFLSNSSRFCSQEDQNMDLFKTTFFNKAQPVFCDTVINNRSTNTLFENITILVVILITITIAIIVSAYVLIKKCSRKQKQHMKKSSLVYKKQTNENTESGYEDPVEVHEYADIGNTNRIFYDLQGNRVNAILGKEQLEYDYAYSH